MMGDKGHTVDSDKAQMKCAFVGGGGGQGLEGTGEPARGLCPGRVSAPGMFDPLGLDFGPSLQGGRPAPS